METVMKKLFACVVAGVMTVASCPSFAGTYTVLGVGSTSCGKFLEMKDSHQVNNVLDTINWTQGFLTGVNVMRSRQGLHSLRTVDVASLDAFLAKDCRDHPLDEIADSSARLVTALISGN